VVVVANLPNHFQLTCQQNKDDQVKINFRSFFVTAGIIGLLVQTPFADPAHADDPVTVVTYSMEVSMNKVSTSLPWSAEGLHAANVMISRAKKRLGKKIDMVKRSGGISMWTQKDTTQDDPSVMALTSKKQVHRISLWATMNNGKKKFLGLLPSDSKNLAEGLIDLKTQHCSLLDFNLFDVTTWWVKKCQVKVPTAPQYLRYALIANLFYAEPGQQYQFNIGELRNIAANGFQFQVLNGNIVSSSLAALTMGGNSLPLHQSSLIGGYDISVGADGKSFTYTELPPDLSALAKAAKLSDDGSYIQFN
jgi:hypothetical protein